MKKIYYLLFLLPVLALSQSQNYIKTTDYKVPTLDGVTATDGTGAITPAKKTVNVMYFDGLGRQMQYVAHLQSGTGKNVIFPIVYDASGMPTKQYMPFASEATTIAYTDNASVIASLPSHYASYGTDGQNPYNEFKIEASPLRRPLKQASPGADWLMPVNAGDPDQTIRFDYLTNTATEVRRLTTTSSSAVGLYSITPIANAGYYASGELIKTVVKDENWISGSNDHTTVEFRNKEGLVVLKRTYESDEEHDTYYVYDQFGNLTYIVPPMVDFSSANINDMLDGYCYQYKYDNRNRLVEKKLPGKGWEFMVYDKLNRIVATGPANSPFTDVTGNLGWMIVKYDVFNRPVLTGWMPVASITEATRQSLQQTNDAHPVANISEVKAATNNATVNNVAFRYSNTAWPASTTNYHVLTVRYYDDYNFPDAPTAFSVEIDGSEKAHYNNSDKKPKGLPTGSWIRILTTSTTTTLAEKSYVLYDEYGRAVRQHTQNHVGGYTQADNKLDFTGKPIHLVTRHKRDAATPAEMYIKDAFGFTDQDRLETHTHQIGTGGTPQLLRRNEYDKRGQLTSKFVGGTNILGGSNALQKIDYSYNIRGWLKGINDVDNLGTDLFAYAINYNTVTNETTPDPSKKVKKLYNGNISETIWKTVGDSKKRRYGYRYDSMNRLTDAIYQKPDMDGPQNPYGGVTNAYNEHVEYDKNGNIKKMLRYGNGDSEEPLASPNKIDDLVYTYQDFTNKLVKVKDESLSEVGFKDGTNTGSDYAHDAYGNIKHDLNKGISDITYNHLNLPKVVTFATGDKIEYIYNAVGTRVSKKVTTNTVVVQSYYLGGFQYKGTALEFFPTAEGYVDATAGATASTAKYVFNFKDHLGNVRLSYTQLPTGGLRILEENHYYPFGMEHSGYNSSTYDYILNGNTAVVSIVPRNKSQYKFNGQEYQDELGLNVTAMDYRQYDGALGRFHSVDVLAELIPGINPYQFGFNNPVYWNDPSGLFPQEPPKKGDPAAIELEDVIVVNNYKPKPAANSSSPFLDMSFGPAFPQSGGGFSAQPGYGYGSGGSRGNAIAVGSITGAGLISLGGNYLPVAGNNLIQPVALSGLFLGENIGVQTTVESGWYSLVGQYNWFFGSIATGIGNADGSFTLGTAKQGFNPKYYGNAWRGNQYASTYNIAKIGKLLGRISFGVAVAADIYGTYEYSENPKSPNAVHPGKAGVNTAIGLWGFTGVGTVPAIFYFGAEAFVPGGFEGLMNGAEGGNAETRRILGPNWRSVPFGGK